MLKSDISSNQLGGSINVARMVIDSSLLGLSVAVFRNGPSSLVKNAVELISEILQNIPTSINTLLEREVISSMAALFEEE